MSWVHQQHRYYSDHQSYQPQITLAAQVNLVRRHQNDQGRDYYRRAMYAQDYRDDIGRKSEPLNREKSLSGKNPNRNYVKLDGRDQELDRRTANIDNIRNMRQKNEVPNKKSRANNDPNNFQPGRPVAKTSGDPVVLPRSEAQGNNRGRQLTNDDIKRAQRDREKEARRQELENKVQLARQNAERDRQDRKLKQVDPNQNRSGFSNQDFQANLARDRARPEDFQNQQNQQRDAKGNTNAERARQLQEARQRTLQQKEQQRLQDKTARAQADQQRQAANQAKISNDAAQRDSQQRAKQQQQQADQARRSQQAQQQQKANQQRQSQQKQERESRPKSNRKKK